MEKITTPAFRVSFPSVFTPAYFDAHTKTTTFPKPGDPNYEKAKYVVTMLIPKSVGIKDIERIVEDAYNEQWPNPKNKPDKEGKNFDWPIEDGDKSKLEGYEGMWVIKAKSKKKPGIVDENLQPLTSEDQFFAGRWARATVVAYSYDNARQGVGLGLQNLKLEKTPEGQSGGAFSGRQSAEADFADFAPSSSEGDDFLS